MADQTDQNIARRPKGKDTEQNAKTPETRTEIGFAALFGTCNRHHFSVGPSPLFGGI
jgi:hypothetical protein